MTRPIRRGAVLGYAIGSLGTGVYLTVPSVLLLYFMTDVLAVRSSLAALAIVLPKLLGALLDPWIGWLSDRTRGPFGRRRPWLLAGALGMGATFVFLFRPPEIHSEAGRFAYVLIVFLLSAVFYSCFATPYVAMPSEMSSSADERGRIMAWRMTFVMGGVILGSALAPILISTFGGGRAGYGAMSFVVGGACAAAMLTTVAATARTEATPSAQERSSLWSELRDVASDRAFLRLAAVFLLQTCVFGLTGALLPYVARHVLGAGEDLVGKMLLVMLASALVFMRPWAAFARRIGPRNALMLASAAHGLLSLSLLGLHRGYPISWLSAQFALVGVAYGGLQLLPFAMLTDVINRDRGVSGRAREGAFSGLWTSVEKLGLAAGPALAAGLLAGFHYQGGGAMSVQGADHVRQALGFAPALVQAISLLLLAGYAGYAGGEAGRSRRGRIAGR